MNNPRYIFCFFFNDTATTEIYTLSLHDALPISSAPRRSRPAAVCRWRTWPRPPCCGHVRVRGSDVTQLKVTQVKDRKSTRLNSSHANISYAVFCLKKKKTWY